MDYLHDILHLFCGFMIGGIPFGLILSKLVKKIDIRDFGSGNIGATNVCRVMGFKYAVLVFILDGLKSFLPVFMARDMFGFDFALYTLCATTLGHIFSPWLGFHGGKGFSCFILGLLALDVKLFLVSGIVWLSVFAIGRISALATLVSTMITTITACFLYRNDVISMVPLMIVIFWAHRNNIRDILDKYNKKE